MGFKEHYEPYDDTTNMAWYTLGSQFPLLMSSKTAL